MDEAALTHQARLWGLSMGEYVKLALGAFQDEILEQRQEDRREKAGKELPSTPRQPKGLDGEGKMRFPQGFREEEVRDDLRRRREADMGSSLPRQAFLATDPRAGVEGEASSEAGWQRWRKGEHERICAEIAEGAVWALEREKEELLRLERQQGEELLTVRRIKERAYKSSHMAVSVLEEEVLAEYEQELLEKQQQTLEARMTNERRLLRAQRNSQRARRRKGRQFEMSLQRLAMALEAAAVDPNMQREAVQAAHEALDWTLLDARQQRRVRQVLCYPLFAEEVIVSEERDVSSDESDTDCEEVRREHAAREQDYARRVRQVGAPGRGEHQEVERVRALRRGERLYEAVIDAAVDVRRAARAVASEGIGHALTAGQAA